MKSVLITRPEPEASDFAEMMRNRGLNPIVFPVIEYQEVATEYDDVENYSSLVFTSAEAVRVFAKNSNIRDKTIYTVGDKTAEEAHVVGFTDVYSACGNSTTLMHLVEEKTNNNSIIHLCSADTPEAAWTRKVIYQSNFVHEIMGSVNVAIKENQIDFVTLLSAKTAESFIEFIKNNNLDNYLANMEAVCISSNVQKVAKTATWKNISVSNMPTEVSMLDLLIT